MLGGTRITRHLEECGPHMGVNLINCLVYIQLTRSISTQEVLQIPILVRLQLCTLIVK